MSLKERCEECYKSYQQTNVVYDKRCYLYQHLKQLALIGRESVCGVLELRLIREEERKKNVAD